MGARNDPRLAGLYVVTDRALCARHGLIPSVTAALAAGIRLVQYRDKSGDDRRRFEEARALAQLCAAHDALLIVNDDARLARDAGAHGVHLGRDDMDIAAARELLGDAAIIGVSCYDDFVRAERAALGGADYVAFGSMFPSPTKPDAVRAPLELLARACAELAVPACAIGGIDATNIRAVIAAGAAMVAVVSAVFAAPDITVAARELEKAFDEESGIRS